MLSPSSAPRALLIMLAVLAGCAVFPLVCLAENGNAQAVMSLIVLPNETNIAAHQVERQGVTPSHQADTSLSILSRTGGKSCRIWITI